MRKNKGFTLIELLAVLVIIAIVAVVTTPIILNVLSNAKKGVAKESANGVIQSVEQARSLDIVQGKDVSGIVTYTYTNSVLTTDPEGMTLNYKGKTPKDGIIYVYSDGKIKAALHDGVYCSSKQDNEETFTTVATTKEDCLSKIVK